MKKVIALSMVIAIATVFFFTVSASAATVNWADTGAEKGFNWLKEESDGTDAWYGFDNTDTQLPKGTSTSVKWYVCGTDSSDQLVLFSKEPLVGTDCNTQG